MSPEAYANEIVIPTIRDFLRARQDRRLAYLSAISTYHLIDYLSLATGIEKPKICENMRENCRSVFDVIQGICNGTKHAGDLRRGYKFKPGAERNFPSVKVTVAGDGVNIASFERASLSVTYGNTEMLLDGCVQVLLIEFADLYKDHLSNIDFSFLDDVVIPAINLPSNPDTIKHKPNGEV